MVGALARSDAAIDFDGTDVAFLESTTFLAAVLAATVLWYFLGRARADLADRALLPLSVTSGGLLFGGVLASDGRAFWPGLIAGAVLALAAAITVRDVTHGARRRLGGEAGLLPLFLDLGAVALAAASVFAWPLGLVASIAVVWLLARVRAARGRKHEGLRTLR